MGNSIYESVVARLSVLAPLLSRTQVDIGLERVGTDPFHVTAVQMAQALNRFILPRIQELTHKTANLDASNVAQVVTDPQRNLIRISSNLSLITGVQYAEAGGFRELLERIVPAPSEFDRNNLALREVVLGGRSLVVTSSMEFDSDGRPKRIISHISDQTLRQKLWSEVSRIHDELEAEVARRTSELRASEESLRRKEEHVRAIIENLPVAIYELMPDGKVSYISPNVQSLWGYKPEEFQQNPDFFYSCVHSDDRAGLRYEGASEYRFFSRHKDDYVWIADVSRAEVDAAGAVQRYCGVMADITSQKELQRQIFHSQKMETVGTLAAGFAHDILNQLTGIMANVEMAAAKSGTSTQAGAELQDALASARRCSDLVRSMLSYGRGLPEDASTSDPNRVVEECVGMLRHSLPRGVHVKVITNPEIWSVRADGARILQVLMNLALNARDAMPDGGTLMIETENHTIDLDYCSRVVDARPGSYVMISVGDTGVGIEDEILPHIFEPFFSTKDSQRSFGMGLAAASGIVKAQRGWIEVLTHPGAGSNFRVFLPRFQDVAETQPEDLERRPVVLVVDDSASIRRMSRKVLEETGFRVLLAEDSQEAMRLFVLNRARIRGLVLDLAGSVKHAMSLMKQVRALSPDIPVLITVGYAPGEPLPDLKNLGARLLSKPFTASELIVAVRDLLEH